MPKLTLEKNIRVLHCFRSLGKGGLETWLMNVLRLHSVNLQFDFFLSVLGGVYEAEARNNNSRIYHAPPIRQFSCYLQFLEEVLLNNQYDVLHVHGEEFMGDILKVAAKVGMPVRIAHCHATQLARGKKGFEMNVRRLRHQTLDRFRILRYATDILACSSDAGRFLMGRYWGDDQRCQSLFCGVPLDQFSSALPKWSRIEFRKEHDIPENAIVVGHVGSMGLTPVKNHTFILKVFSELVRRNQRYFLYLAGDGPQRYALKQKVIDLGLKSRVKMPGLCNNIESLMVHGFDVHLLPSLREGLPVVGLEAVASGLFTVCSDSITKDFTNYFPERISTLSLCDDVSIWADTVMAGVDKRLSPQEGVALVEKSPFSIHSSCLALTNVYQMALRKSCKQPVL